MGDPSPGRSVRFWRHMVRCPFTDQLVPTGSYERTGPGDGPLSAEEHGEMISGFECPACHRQHGWSTQDTDFQAEQIGWEDIPLEKRQAFVEGHRLFEERERP